MSLLPLSDFRLLLPRLLLPAFCFLLSTLAWLTPASLHAETTLNIKPGDDQVRATDRLHDFLSDIGYAVEFYDEDKDVLIIHQQKHRIRAVILVGENELSSVVLSVHYHLNKKAATSTERAACMNLINASQYGVKACVDEEREDFYLEYILPFDGSLSPRAMKRFADQVVARTYLMVVNDKALNAVIFGADDDSPDTARNADEVEDADAENCDPEEAPAIPTPSPSSATQPSSPANQPPRHSANQPSPSPATQPSSQPANQPTSPVTPSLETALPPTTPAEPARPKKARA